ncbi:MAG: hypothetical protein ACFE9S_09325 [Candidatus Hermodarchaeota archaeon]
MLNSNFFDIINMHGLRVSIPDSSHFSLGTSPYYAHQHGLAIDIYYNLTLENYEMLSPISGKVIKLKTLGAPKPSFINGIDKDYLILIGNKKYPEVVWKMMHVKPRVKVGDEVRISDILGETIRNGYFAYWSSPHLHLELRPSNDAIRARGGKEFSLAIKNEKITPQIAEQENLKEIPIKIDSIYPEIILANLPKHLYLNLDPFYGVKARLNNIKCILDGGIPHYKIGTVICWQKSSFEINSPVYFGEFKVGNIHETNGKFGFLKFKDIKFLLNNVEIRGISLYLAKFSPLIKIIPYRKNEFSFKSKSIQYLRLVGIS